MLLDDVVQAWREVGELTGRNAKIARLRECLGGMDDGERPIGVSWLCGLLPQGRIGIGWAAVRAAACTPAADPTLTIRELDERLGDIAAIAGKGSKARRQEALGSIWARATEDEQNFVSHLVMGHLRQGAKESLVLSALAKLHGVPAKLVRRAHMLVGDVADVTRLAVEGRAALQAASLRLFVPVKPMLAQPADDVEEVLARHGETLFELKLDGARVQLHRRGDEVRVYSRGLHDVTAAVPELVESALEFPCDDIVLDGETLSLKPDGSPQSFQTTMRRFGRKLDVTAMRGELPLSVFWFDCLQVDGQPLLDETTEDRIAAMCRVVPAEQRVQQIVTDDVEVASAFYDDVLSRGHEGVMAKALTSPYAAGSRGHHWFKLKSAHTVDLVILAVEWGSGRRKGWLSNLHLGARGPDGTFVMIGKTFKGLTDAMLQWQTDELLKRELGRDGHVVYVEPTLVVEVAFADVQVSRHYPGGVALRFARVKHHRPDRDPASVEPIEEIRARLP